LILHTVEIRASRQRVYAALSTREGLTGWWTTTVSGESTVGETLTFRFADVFKPEMRVLTLEPDTLVRWTCVGGEADWRDNVFVFALSDAAGVTTLLFRQEYARELDDRTYGS